MSFADSYATRMDELFDRLVCSTMDVRLRARLHQAKLNAVVGAYSIASSPNPGVALLDMAAYMRMKRDIMEEYGHQEFPEVPDGPIMVEAILASFRHSEQEIWAVAERALSPQQIEELNELIVRWRAENPDQTRVTQVRLSEFSATRRLAPGSTQRASGSLLSFLMIDPLANMEPTAREIEQTRRIAERAFFVAERMPMIMAWQIEQVVYNAAATPEAQQLLGNANTLSDSVERFSLAADRLPQDMAKQSDATIARLTEAVGSERNAAIEQLQQLLEGERTRLVAQLEDSSALLKQLLADMRDTMRVGGEMAQSVEAATMAIDVLATPSPSSGSSNARPFDPIDYKDAAQEIGAAARNITELMQSIERLTTASSAPDADNHFSLMFDSAEAGGVRLIDQAFNRALLLVAIILVGVPLGLLGYRLASRRLK
jgi:hypothetical protein